MSGAEGFADPLPPWRHWSLAERERAYSPSSSIGGDWSPYRRAYQDRSAAARREAAALGGRWQRLDYGPLPSQGIELCLPPAAPTAVPLLVYIHGGYWQALSAQESLFAASGCIERGIAFAAVDYTLAPLATVAGIVAECRLALAALIGQAAALGIDAARIVVAGSSAGAHLAAQCALPEARDHYPGGQGPAATVLVSGVYWLAPLVGTSINAALRLDEAAAVAVSPGHRQLAGFPRSLLAWGEIEPLPFEQQSRAFAAALAVRGTPVGLMPVAGRNHFDVILDLADPATALGAATLALLLDRPAVPAG